MSKKIKKSIFSYLLKIFFFIFIIIISYIFYNLIVVFNKNRIVTYEVIKGEIVNVDRHKGFIYREENVSNCSASGFINFYVVNRERVYRGKLIYTINDVEKENASFDLTDNEKLKILNDISKENNSITNLNFNNIYSFKDNLSRTIDEYNLLKVYEDIDVENEIEAKEKGFSKVAGIVSFILDGYENYDIVDFNEDLLNNYIKSNSNLQKKEVASNDKIFKIITDSEFSIAFDSDYDYDKSKNNWYNVRFVNENIKTSAKIEGFIGSDGNKHYKLVLNDYIEKFSDKRIVDFEIENKDVTGFKIPIKSIISKNCYIVPKTILTTDDSTNEKYFYKKLPSGENIKVVCNISKIDDKYVYIAIDDVRDILKYGDVLTNKYGDICSLSTVNELNGVYNVNRGYAQFKIVDIIDRTNEYAVIKTNTQNGIVIYDHIALNASQINVGETI